MLRLSRSVLARAAAVATGTASISLCHGHSSEEGRDDVDAKIEALTERLSMLEAATAKRYGVSQTTGQNGAVFSWDERLTAQFPAECAAHEADLHGSRVQRAPEHALEDAERPRKASRLVPGQVLARALELLAMKVGVRRAPRHQPPHRAVRSHCPPWRSR